MKLKITFLLLIYCLLASSCLRTEIRAPEINPALSRLSSASNKEISLKVTSKLNSEDSIGSQYLMLLIPFGSINVGGAKHIVTNSALEKLISLGL